MNWQKIILPLGAAIVIVLAYQSYGWSGVVLGVTALATYLIVQFNRMLKILKVTAQRPKGFVESAVMFNARLKPGDNLLRVMQMTQSIGEPLTPEGQEPELFRWTDASASHVTCEFVKGRLAKWTLERPAEAPPEPPPAAP